MTPVTIVGHARLSPYLVRSPNKGPEALFTVATAYRTLTGVDEVQERTTETRVLAYGDLAEHAAASINKGTHVIVTGLKEGTGVLVAAEIGLALSLKPQGGGSRGDGVPTTGGGNEMTTDDDEIKVGDTVELHDALGRLEVLATNRPGGRWLWVYSGDRPPFTISTDDCRKVKPPTPCPEGWANVYPEFISWHSTKEAAVSSAARRCIGVLHLLPSGDTEFIRTEEL